MAVRAFFLPVRIFPDGSTGRSPLCPSVRTISQGPRKSVGVNVRCRSSPPQLPPPPPSAPATVAAASETRKPYGCRRRRNAISCARTTPRNAADDGCRSSRLFQGWAGEIDMYSGHSAAGTRLERLLSSPASDASLRARVSRRLDETPSHLSLKRSLFQSSRQTRVPALTPSSHPPSPARAPRSRTRRDV
jgi:hypothetical protein